MKICPICRLQARLDAASCAQCGHIYRTKFVNQSLITTQPIKVQPQPPAPPSTAPPAQGQFLRAPEPPTFWEQFWNPLARTRYRVELVAYLNATGALTDGHKKDFGHFMKFVYVAVGLIIIYSIYDMINTNQKLDRDLERIQHQYDRPSQPPSDQFPP